MKFKHSKFGRLDYHVIKTKRDTNTFIHTVHQIYSQTLIIISKVLDISGFSYQFKEDLERGLHNLPELLFQLAAFVLKSCVPVKSAEKLACQCVHCGGDLGHSEHKLNSSTRRFTTSEEHKVV